MLKSQAGALAASIRSAARNEIEAPEYRHSFR